MSRELSYRVSLKSETSGARAVSAAMQSIDQKAGELTQSYVAMRSAAQGNVLGIAQLTRQIGFLAFAAKGAQAAMGWIGIALGIAQIAWSMFREKQEKNAQAVKEATDKLVESQKRLNETIAALQAPNYDRQIAAIRDMTDAYSEAQSAAGRLKDIQDKIAAAQTSAGMASIRAQAARESSATDDPGQRAAIAHNAELEVNHLQTQADLDALQREIVANKATIDNLAKKAFGLAYQKNFDEYNQQGHQQQAEAQVAQLEKRKEKLNKKIAATPPAASADLIQEQAVVTDDLDKAIRNRDALRRQHEDLVKSRDKQLRDTDAELAAAREMQAAFQAKRQEIIEKSKERQANLYDQEAQRERALREKADADAKKTAQDSLRAEAQQQTESVQKRAEQEKQNFAVQAQISERTSKEASEIADRLRERILSPSVRRAQDKEERAAQREARRLDDKIARAEAQAGRGARGKWMEDVSSYVDARKIAEEKANEAAALERKAWEAQVNAETKLSEIKTMLEANLRAAG